MILFITRKYPPSVGGMQNLSHRLTTEVSKQTEAHVISWGGSQRWLPLFIVRAFIQALTVLIRGNVTLVHIGDPVLSPLGVMLRVLGRVPVVVNAHGLDVTYPHPFYQVVIPACLRRLDRVICISNYTKEECIHRGVSAEHCVVIPLGVDVENYTAALPDNESQTWAASWGVSLLNRHVLLTVGRLVPRKGIAPFVSRALPLLLARRQDWVYLIVGDGPERTAIEAAVESQGLSRYVSLLGHLGDDALRAAYALADLFVMPNVPTPSDPEGFGLVTLEAQAAGVPIVAADLEGISEAVSDEEDGTLVKPGEWSEFVKAISAWLDCEETTADREQRRQRTKAQFAWSRIAAQYLEVFRGVEEEHCIRRRMKFAGRD